MKKLISILIPVYNEEGNVPAITKAIQEVFANLAFDFEIVFVNDGSADNSLSIIKKIAETQTNIFYISFSRNFGKDNALLAGLKYANGDAIVTIDADLQHPPEMIPEMLALWEQGNDIVYTHSYYKNLQHSLMF